MSASFSFPFDSGGNEAAGSGSSSASCDVCHRELNAQREVQTLSCLHNFCLNCCPVQGNPCPICVGSEFSTGSPAFDAHLSNTSQKVPHPSATYGPQFVYNHNSQRNTAQDPRSSVSESLGRGLSSPLQDVSTLHIDTGNIWGNIIASPSFNAESRNIQREFTPQQRLLGSFSSLSEPFGSSYNNSAVPRGAQLPFNPFSNKTHFGETPGPFNEFNSLANLPHPGTIGPPVSGNGSSMMNVLSGRPSNSQCTCCNEAMMATSKCEDCCELLCANCVQAHYRVRLTRDHMVTSLHDSMGRRRHYLDAILTPSTGSSGATDLGTSSSMSTGSRPSPLVSPPGLNQSTFCIDHKDPLWILCDTCAKPLCRKCLPDHTAHSFSPIKGNNIKGIATQMLAECRNVQRTLEEALEGVQRTNERVEARVLSVANEVRATLHFHISALEERKRDLLQRVDTVRQSKVQSLEGQRESLVTLLSSIRSASDQAEAALNMPNDQNGSAPARVQQLLLQHLSDTRPYLQPHETDALSFLAPDPSILASIRNLGTIQAGAFAGKCSIIGDSYRRAVRDRATYMTVQARDAVGDSCVSGGDSVLVQILNAHGQPLDVQVQDRQNGTYLVSYKPNTDGPHTVRITVRGKMISGSPFTVQVRKGRDYSGLGAHPRSSFGVEGALDGQISRPWGMCCDRSGRVIVADRSNNRIQIFDRDGRFLFKFGVGGSRPGQFDRPAGILVNSKNQIIVADKDNHRVQIFTMDGAYVLRFGERGRGNGQFHYPWDVAVNGEDQIAVTDTRNHRVQLFSAEGAFVKKFGFDNAMFYKHFDSPRGVCFMPDGHMLVTDFNNHRLVVINTTTAEMKFYGKEGEIDGHFKRPQGLDVDLEGYVIVADSKNNRLQVFSPELIPVCSFGWEGAEKHPLLDRPVDVCIAPDGRVYVCDMGNNRICIF